MRLTCILSGQVPITYALYTLTHLWLLAVPMATHAYRWQTILTKKDNYAIVHATEAAIHKLIYLGNIDKSWDSLNSTDENQAYNWLLQVTQCVSGSEHFVFGCENKRV
jgi:hypothetical protein